MKLTMMKTYRADLNEKEWKEVRKLVSLINILFLDKVKRKVLFLHDYFRTIYLLKLNEKIIGVGVLKNNFIFQLAIKPSKQGKGYGTKLLNYIIEDIKELGYDHIECSCNDNSFNFWHKNGFVSKGYIQMRRDI